MNIKNLHILVVDDIDVVRNLQKSCLQEAGYLNTHIAINGEHALRHVEKHPVDLVICDWGMPKVCGLSVLLSLRKNEKTKNTPFIMVTATNEPAKIKQAISAGVSDYLTKPFKPSQLLDRVSRTVKKMNKATITN